MCPATVWIIFTEYWT